MGSIKVEKKNDKKSEDERQGEGRGSSLAERSDYLPWNWFFDFDDVLRDFRHSFRRWLPSSDKGSNFTP